MTIDWLDFPTPPALLGSYARAAVRRSVTGITLPNLGLRSSISVSPKHLNAYRQLCGFEKSSLLPATYPHVLAFALQIKLLTDKQFPFPLLGLVHLENSIQVLRPLAGLGPFTISVHLENLHEHEKGSVFSVITRLEDQLGLLWQADSRILCRSTKLGGPAQPRKEPPSLELAELAHWSAPSNIGRRYARISGDYNPIHTLALTAKLFGFPRAIAHGLWNKAHAIAALSEHLPASGYQIYVRFQKPVLLPSKLTLSASQPAPSGQFSLTGADQLQHLKGEWQPLA